jgi:hypothetical protein
MFTGMLIILLLCNFAISKNYKEVLDDLQHCPCDENEFCRDGTCVAADPNEMATTLANIRNYVTNSTNIQNCLNNSPTLQEATDS